MDYLIEENGKIIRYFYHPQIGICNSCLKNGVWQEKNPVYVDSLDCFGLFAKNNNIHIVAPNKNKELVYLYGNAQGFRKFILKKISDDVKFFKIFVYQLKTRLNILYTVLVKDEIQLLHCVLGNNAKPHLVAKLLSPDFYVFENRVYFVLPNHDSAFCDLANQTPQPFVKVATNSGVPYILNSHIAFISNDKIFFDNRELCQDKGAKDVIITENNGELYCIWKSNAFLKSICATKRENRIKTYVNTSTQASLCLLYKDDIFSHIYATITDTGLITYTKPNVCADIGIENTKNICNRLEDMKKEIVLLKQQLSEHLEQKPI